MKLKTPIPLIRAALIALIVAAIAWIGIDIPREAVEESVDQQLDQWQGEGDSVTDVDVSTSTEG